MAGKCMRRRRRRFSLLQITFLLSNRISSKWNIFFSALRMLLCLLRQLPLNVTALAKVYIFSVSLTSFLVFGQKGLKIGFCRFAILAYDKSTRSHE